MTAAEKIKSIRIASGQSQSKFAETLGITKELVSQMERGVKNISSATASHLARIMKESNIPIPFIEDYKRGQRFAKVVDILLKKGYTLGSLKDKTFKAKISDLNCMFIGIKPIPETIVKGLKALKINPNFLDEGKQQILLGEGNKKIKNETSLHYPNKTFEEEKDNAKTKEKKIKELRLAAGLTQVEFAKNLNISSYFLNSIENGYRELSDTTARLMASSIAENEIPAKIKECFREGQNLAGIVNKIRETGVTLHQLINIDLPITGKELSLIYLGLIPIPAKVKHILKDKYKVNPQFFSLGKKVPMFLNNTIEESEIEFPYFNNKPFHEAINRYEQQNFEDTLNLFFPEINVDLFIDIAGDNLSPTFYGREILALKKTSSQNINYGSIYLIQFMNGECQLRRIFQNSDEKKLTLKKEDKNFPEVVIEKKTIELLFVVKIVINKDFY